MQNQTFLEVTDQDTETSKPKKTKRGIFAYILRRSPVSQLQFNVLAVDKNGEHLAVVESDLDFDTAAAQVEELNKQVLKRLIK